MKQVMSCAKGRAVIPELTIVRLSCSSQCAEMVTERGSVGVHARSAPRAAGQTHQRMAGSGHKRACACHAAARTLHCSGPARRPRVVPGAAV